MEIEKQDTQEADYEREKYEERESEKYDFDEEVMRDTKRALDTHKSIMRAMGLDEKYEKHLWDARHGL